MKVAVIMGSKSDPSCSGEYNNTLRGFGVDVEAHVMSAQPVARAGGGVCGQSQGERRGGNNRSGGKSAHLAGVIAGHTTTPRDRAAHKIIADGRAGFTAFHSADAGGHTRSYGSGENEARTPRCWLCRCCR